MSPTEDASPLAEDDPPAATTNPVLRYLARFDDGEVLRWAFRGLIIGAIGVLGMDLSDLSRTNGWGDESAVVGPVEPVLPPAVETDTPVPPSDPRPFLTGDDTLLRQPMAFTLEPGGVLRAEGSIDTGTAKRLAGEFAERGEYVRSLSLNSPGGVLDEAIEMAALVRARGLATQVADGALCASSCPLLFAGGVARSAGAKAAIGVHQFYATIGDGIAREQVMANAQSTTAQISRHLAAMGVDPALWLHALDTPPRALYYFTPKELADYRLVTGPASVAKN
jgi:hypothetical protein